MRKFASIIITSILFLNSCTFTTQQKERIHVIVLAGQSNMVGAGLYTDLSEQQKHAVKMASRNVMLANQGGIAKPLAPRESQKHLDYYGSLHVFGPELFLGVEITKINPSTQYLIIKTAVGGTSLYGAWNPQWQQDKANLSEKSEERRNMQLFWMHIERIKEQLSLLEKQGKEIKLVGVGWFQGEQDSVREITATQYAENLKLLIHSYRKQLNAPNLPFVMAQINNPPKQYKYGPTIVRQAMEQVAASAENIDLIKTTEHAPWNDFPKHKDNVHYNTEGQTKFGLEFAKRFIKLDH